MCWYPLQRRIWWGSYTIGEALILLLTLGYSADLMFSSWGHMGKSGNAASIPLFLCFTLACRNSVWTFLLGLPFERSLFWHKVMAILAVIMGGYHGLLSWYFGHKSHRNPNFQVSTSAEAGRKLLQGMDAGYSWPIDPTAEDFSASAGTGRVAVEGAYSEAARGREVMEDIYVGTWGLSITDDHFISGWLMVFCMLVLLLSSLFPKLRRLYFNSWLAVHLVSIVGVVVFALMHNVDAIIIGLAFYGVDLILRYVWMAGLRNPKKVELVALPGDVVRVAWPREDFHYMGDWTRALHTLASNKGREANGELVEVTAFIEGPYGSPSLDFCGERHTQFLLISGGIGVTPMQSVLNDLLSQHKRGRSLKLIWWVVLDYDQKYAAKNLPNQLPTSFSPDLVMPKASLSSDAQLRSPHSAPVHDPEDQRSDFGEDFLHTEFFLTQEHAATQASSHPGTQSTSHPAMQSTTHPGTQSGSHLASQASLASIAPEQQQYIRFGRPDIYATLLEAARISSIRSPQSPRLAVMVCGPPGMVSDVEHISHKMNGAYGVTFDFHKEVFDF
eukprot:gene29008-32199_t